MNLASTPSFELKRDFLFSNVLTKLSTMSQGIISDEEKHSLARKLETFKSLLSNKDTLRLAFSHSRDDRKTALNAVTTQNPEDSGFFETALNETHLPSQDLLVRNRFVVLLRNQIENSSDDPVVKEALEIASLYFGTEIIRPETIRQAASNAVGSMSARYKPEAVPTLEKISQNLFGLLDEAIAAQQANPSEIMIPDPFSHDRLEGLKVNL